MKFHVASIHEIPIAESGESELDRRHTNRITTIYRPAIVHVGDFSGFCLVRYISASGLLGMVYADFAPDQDVTVDFSEQHSVQGTVVWSREGRIGVSFDKPIDILSVLQELGRKTLDDRVNRAPRLTIQCPITLESSERTENTAMHNISQRGIKVTTVTLRPADEVFVHLEGLDPRKALVRWTDNGMAGLNFVRPIEFDKLAGWAIGFQARRWAKQGQQA